VELLGDIFENEDQYEEIEGIERPAEIAGDDSVALLRGERAQALHCGHHCSSVRKRRRGGQFPDAVEERDRPGMGEVDAVTGSLV